jgi:acetylglutamate kinase
MAEQTKNVHTVSDVKQRLDEIREAMSVGANSTAGAMASDLRAEVLLAIANWAPILGGKWAQEMASTVRQSYRIEAGLEGKRQ